VLITYIVKSTKNQKGQTPENGFALLKNDITTFEPTSKLGIHSRYMQSGFVTGSLEIKGFELPRNLCYIAVIKGPDISS
jgi:hypothetical protein